MIQDVAVDGKKVSFTVVLTTPACPLKELIHNASKAFDSTASDFTVKSDNYLRFLVTELKPFIDATYATLPDRANTFVAGSSMGGLISMYAICEYPKVFGGAACISTHWPGIVNINNNPIPNAFLRYLQKHLPDPATHRIYFDCGDATLDSLYPPLQKKVDQVMKKKRFSSKNWMTSYLTGGVAHSEKDWNFRLHQPLVFMLGVANKSK
jgi:pimeloyl-ACP methyl ester carboxylesterase